MPRLNEDGGWGRRTASPLLAAVQRSDVRLSGLDPGLRTARVCRSDSLQEDKILAVSWKQAAELAELTDAEIDLVVWAGIKACESNLATAERMDRHEAAMKAMFDQLDYLRQHVGLPAGDTPADTDNQGGAHLRVVRSEETHAAPS